MVVLHTSRWYIRVLVVMIFKFPGSTNIIIAIWGWSLHGDIILRSEPFLLPFSSLVVLEPIKDILAFDFAVLSKPSRDLLNLLCTWGPNSIVVVKILQYSYLVCCGSPPCTALPAKKPSFSTASILVWWVLLLLLLLLRFHEDKKKTKRRKQKRMLDG